MTTLAESLGTIRKPWQWLLIGGAILLVWAAIAIPNLQRSSESLGPQHAGATDKFAGYLATPAASRMASQELSLTVKAPDTQPRGPAGAERKIVRTSSMSMVVQNPSQITLQIAKLAEAVGGYLVSSDSGSQNSASLTIRVPANQFEEVRAQIRKLGLRVDSEKVEAEDVTRQYVDQDATIRNLRAEEAGYLYILQQAHTVKDMLAVSEQLSNVRGQIEEQQAEFNALSKQIETVAISISLRTELKEQVFGLNWRPLYQIKLALRDGLDAVGNYGTAMISILFYLPSVLLWVGTILLVILGSWRVVLWGGRRWFGSKTEVASS